LKVYIRCCIETDTYKIEDFKEGAMVSVHPAEFGHPTPCISKKLKTKDIDEISDSITLTDRATSAVVF